MRRSFTIALFLIALCPASLRAQNVLQPSTDEQVAIAFFKAADTNPDFEKWAKGTKEYKIVPPTRVDEYIDREKQRLMTQWRDFNLDEDVLNIRGRITVHLKQGVDENGNETYRMEMTFGKDDAPYFPFVFQDYKFAVVPQKLEQLLIQPLTKSQFSLIYTDFDEKLTASAYLYLQLKAARSYIEQPYEIDGIEQWVLLADPVTLSLKSGRTGADLWTYGASWYVSPAKQEVRDLYQKADTVAPTPQTPE